MNLRRLLPLLLATATACSGEPGAVSTPAPPVTTPPPSTAPPSTPSTPTPSTPPSSPRPTRPPATTPPFSVDRAKIRVTRFIAGLSRPVLLTHAGDGSGRVYVVEQAGRIRVYDDAGHDLGVFLDIRGRVGSGGNEQGLLGLAFHPDYRGNGRFFVNYTDRRGDTVIAEYRRSNATRADAGSERSLLRIDQPFSNHNGGMIAFGRDGNLYVATGDGGSQGDPNNNAQSAESLLGKILRLDVSAPGRYTSPADNPFVGRAGRDEIWARGLRNPWRFSFDRGNGAFYAGDVGGRQREEIDARTESGARGANYGWRVVEGDRCHNPSSGCSRAGFVAPAAVYPTSRGCAVTGGYVYRGSRHPSLRGGYFFADYCSGEIFVLDAAAALRGATGFRVAADTGMQVSSFGEDQAGEVYVVDHGGSVMRLAAA